MADGVLIELGELSDQPEDVDPPGRTRPAIHRPLLLVVVLLLAPLALVAGSGTVLRSLTEIRIPAVAGDAMTVAYDRVYLTRAVAMGNVRVLSAYRLPDGAPLWQTEVTGTGYPSGDLGQVGDAVLLRWQNDSGEFVGFSALDAATGRQRWKHSGWLRGLVAGPPGGAPRLLLGGPGNPEDGVEMINAVDLRTGAVAWSYRAPRGALVQVAGMEADGEGTLLVTGLPSGQVEVRDAVTLGLRATSTVRGAVALDPLDQIPQWLATTENLMLVTNWENRTLSGYGLPKLDQRWQVPWEADGIGWYTAVSCADKLCLQVHQDHYRAVDPGTGRVHWQQRWSYLEPFGPMLLGYQGPNQPDTEIPLVLVDPATGLPRRSLGTWSLVTRPWEEADVTLSRRNPKTGRMWLGLLRRGAADVRLLGVITDVANCRGAKESVVCRRLDSSVGIWSYQPDE